MPSRRPSRGHRPGRAPDEPHRAGATEDAARQGPRQPPGTARH